MHAYLRSRQVLFRWRVRIGNGALRLLHILHGITDIIIIENSFFIIVILIRDKSFLLLVILNIKLFQCTACLPRHLVSDNRTTWRCCQRTTTTAFPHLKCSQQPTWSQWWGCYICSHLCRTCREGWYGRLSSGSPLLLLCSMWKEVLWGRPRRGGHLFMWYRSWEVYQIEVDQYNPSQQCLWPIAWDNRRVPWPRQGHPSPPWSDLQMLCSDHRWWGQWHCGPRSVQTLQCSCEN